MTDRVVAARRQLASLVEERCRLLGLQRDCPHVVLHPSGGELEFAAYLPQFGSSRGLLVDVVTEPDYVPSVIHKTAATRLGIPVSFVNPASVLEEADEFIGALRDWGYFGRPEELREDVKTLLLKTRN